jgi:RND family efflux transporter MFP subunit
LGGAAALLVAACHGHAPEAHDEPTAVTVRCVPAQRQVIRVTRTLRGRLAAPPGGDLPVASQVPGRLLDVAVHEGDRIVTGAVIATVDDSTTRDALRQADAALVQAKSAAANADATLERTRQLVARGIAAKQELDDGVARADQAHAAVNASAAALDTARRTLGRVRVVSSFDGVITRVWRGPGALVDGTPATPIVQLAATALAEFDADATERQLTDVAAGQAAMVVLASTGDPMAGTVRARSSALDPATGLGLVRIAIDPKGTVLLGMFGRATVEVGDRSGALVVPTEAVRGAAADGAEVAVCNGAKAELRTVRVGWRDDARVEVIDGVAEGERVAIDHVLGLETGSPIIAVDSPFPTEPFGGSRKDAGPGSP